MNSILSRNPQTVQQSTPVNNQMQMIQQFQQFKNSFKGNPKQIVMNMLQRGQITNPQLQQAMQMAKQLKGILK
jgi:hypothetical protein